MCVSFHKETWSYAMSFQRYGSIRSMSLHRETWSGTHEPAHRDMKLNNWIYLQNTKLCACLESDRLFAKVAIQKAVVEVSKRAGFEIINSLDAKKMS